MTKSSAVSSELLKEFSRHPQQQRQVLIGYVGDIEEIKSNLKKEAINIEGELEEMDILKSKIDYNDLIKLQNMEGVEWIETDDEVRIN